MSSAMTYYLESCVNSIYNHPSHPFYAIICRIGYASCMQTGRLPSPTRPQVVSLRVLLGPLFFSIFINDVSSVIHDCHFLLYADDVKIFKAVSNTASCSALQRAITSFSDWGSRNELLINTSKTEVLTYTRKTGSILFSYNIGGEALPRVGEVKDLGVNFDSKLSFSPPIREVTRQALRSLGVLCRLSKEFKKPGSFLKL